MMLLPILMLVTAAGEPPKVSYVTKVVTKSWTPIELADVEKMIEASALEPLTRAGTMQLQKSSYADLKKGDYTLLVDGRFIEEAEKFSVYLTFGSGTRSDVPSFHVSDTESLGGLPRAKMQEKIESLAKRAGKKLGDVLAPVLESARLHVDPPPIEAPSLPWTWGAIEIPDVSSPSRALHDLLDVRNEDHVRFKALADISAHVFDQPAARDAVVLCTLRDPSPKLRAECARALAPVARNHAPTQRVLLLAMRNEIDEGVLDALMELAKTFVGLSRKECIETWLEVVASDATPGPAVERIASVLAEEGDVPNLDFAVAKCLQQESVAQSKKYACADTLLRVIPPKRRRAVVWKYLETIEVHEQGEMNDYERIQEHLSERGKEPMDAALAELFLRIAERRSAGWARQQAIWVASRHPNPTPALIERFLVLAYEPRLTRQALQAVDELTRKRPELRAMALGGEKRLQEKAHFIKQKLGGDPNEELKEAIRRLEGSK